MKQWTFGTDRHGDDSAVCQRLPGRCAAQYVFLNLSWILYGLLFVIHPVYPSRQSSATVKKVPKR